MMTTITLPRPRPWRLAADRGREASASGACLARLAAGDEAASAELYDRFGEELYGFALWITGSPPDAADVVQELFLRLIRGRGLPRGAAAADRSLHRWRGASRAPPDGSLLLEVPGASELWRANHAIQSRLGEHQFRWQLPAPR